MSNKLVSFVQRTAEGSATRVILNADGIMFTFRKDINGKVVYSGREKGAHVHTGLYVPKELYSKVVRTAHAVLLQAPKKPTQMGFKFDQEVK